MYLLANATSTTTSYTGQVAAIISFLSILKILHFEHFLILLPILPRFGKELKAYDPIHFLFVLVICFVFLHARLNMFKQILPHTNKTFDT